MITTQRFLPKSMLYYYPTGIIHSLLHSKRDENCGIFVSVMAYAIVIVVHLIYTYFSHSEMLSVHMFYRHQACIGLLPLILMVSANEFEL